MITVTVEIEVTDLGIGLHSRPREQLREDQSELDTEMERILAVRVCKFVEELHNKLVSELMAFCPDGTQAATIHHEPGGTSAVVEAFKARLHRKDDVEE